MILSYLKNGSFINKTHGGRNNFYLNLIRINKRNVVTRVMSVIEPIRKFSSTNQNQGPLYAFRKKATSSILNHNHPVIARHAENEAELEIAAIMTGSNKYNPSRNYMLHPIKFDGNDSTSQNVIILDDMKTVPATDFEIDPVLTKQLNSADIPINGILEAAKKALALERAFLVEKEIERQRRLTEAAQKVQSKVNWRQYCRDDDDRKRREKLDADEKRRQEIRSKNEKNNIIKKPDDNDIT